ncbi:hypothetical protein ND861_03645 [Leptospira sp. 2 VSF19]|uniref:Lipoprotein n=1 Tax=Leptospira soteropolitanensis TaxID=2950025 RepID=A0AAW5VA39_9LEPT|nr:hypothetical protein [Leptospira soteropolitanensis]MCW7491740.1 hypothetical protein [Leptospira soteropolitanensis]MCW7499325.1 hypothetical protein [Leptospira soteropolitanensis]MCW7521084.1 hypothetical protein [Leptospira soteropolitanensis]MCW7525428.1 hypothetical protein [Leptospira soteropolitanensis]MCW7529295.1 hypothetical protein [Leptospira soteropolitanensis]
MKLSLSKIGIFFVFCGLSIHCIQNRDDLFYSGQEGNQKIFETYALKNSACGTNKLPGALLLGRVKIDDLKLCFRAIELIDCVTWNTEGYVPGSCKNIGTSFK